MSSRDLRMPNPRCRWNCPRRHDGQAECKCGTPPADWQPTRPTCQHFVWTEDECLECRAEGRQDDKPEAKYQSPTNRIGISSNDDKPDDDTKIESLHHDDLAERNETLRNDDKPECLCQYSGYDPRCNKHRVPRSETRNTADDKPDGYVIAAEGGYTDGHADGVAAERERIAEQARNEPEKAIYVGGGTWLFPRAALDVEVQAERARIADLVEATSRRYHAADLMQRCTVGGMLRRLAAGIREGEK